jgi:Bacterial extracellular solute-binding proteins, family 5 Middle.
MDEEFKALQDQLAELNKDPEANKAAIEEIEGKINARIEGMTDEEKAEYQAKKDELWNNVKIAVKEDGSVIEITLKVPAPYFPNLVAFPVYNPVNKDFYEKHKAAGDYCTEASGLPSNGPWKVVEWKHDDYFKLVRNEYYWNKDNINIDEMNIKIVNDVATRTNLLKTGELDGSAIQASDLKEFEDMATLNQYNLQPLVNKPDFGSFYIEINYNYEGEGAEALKNANIRKALAYAIDREGYVEKISLGDKPALALIPYSFPGYEKTFREEAGEELFEDNNKEKAREFLQKGLEELGITADELKLSMMIGDSDISKKSAEKIQADWAEIGINVELEALPWSEQLARLQSGNYMMSNSGWGPDYPDPMTFLEIFRSDSPNNNGGYSNSEYDELLNKAMNEKDDKKRMEYLYEAEKILIQEDMGVIPNYYRIAHWTYKNYLTGVVNRGVGATTDFYFADIDMAAKMADQK